MAYNDGMAFWEWDEWVVLFETSFWDTAWDHFYFGCIHVLLFYKIRGVGWT
jgi:hypothetical protein